MSKVIVFDVETTGKDTETDQIIEFSVKFGIDPSTKEETFRVRPTIEIHPKAQEVHGISMEDLKECKPFKTLGKKFHKILNQADIWIGYNVSFDITILQAEFKRNGMEEIDLTDKIIIDPFKLWLEKEPRTLENAYKRFVGEDLHGAHAADIDTKATAEVLSAQIAEYNLGSLTPKEIMLQCDPTRVRWIGPSKHIQWSDAGIPVIAYGGKHNEKSVFELAKSDERYCNWMITKGGFPKHVRDIISEAVYLKKEEDLVDYINKHYGKFTESVAPNEELNT